MEFTVLERPLVVEWAGAGAVERAAEAIHTFRDLAARVADGRPADLRVDAASADPDVLLERLAQQLCGWAIHTRRRDLVMIHAGAVADPVTGAAVGLIGPSGAGKSTAVTELGRSWAYLGDEVLAVRDDGQVVPLPKPVSVIEPGRAAKRQVAASDLDLIRAPTDPWLAGLLYLDRRPTTEVRVEALATVDALALLVPQVSFLAARPRPLRRIAGHLERVGGLRRVTYQECSDLPGVLHDLLPVSR